MDLVSCFYEFFQKPRSGEVYNIGGGRFSNASMMESIQICEEISGKKLNTLTRKTTELATISGGSAIPASSLKHYPAWKQRFNIRAILQQIFENSMDRWEVEAV